MRARQLVPHAAQPAARAVFAALSRPTRRWRMQPSFIVIGGQRCGTTSIFKYLADHPQVRRPPVDKGTDYYTLNYWRGIDWYRSRFPLARGSRTTAGGQQITFEACTYYMFHPYAIERLAKDYPDIKLVAMLRDPVERAFSAYKHEHARGFDPAPEFMRALELEDSRLDGEIEKLADTRYESFAHRHHAYRRRGEFADQIERVFKHFDRSQVHILDSEAFFSAPAQEYGALLKFLGLREWSPHTFERHNARPSSAMPTDARTFLTDHYALHNARLADILGRQPSWSFKEQPRRDTRS